MLMARIEFAAADLRRLFASERLGVAMFATLVYLTRNPAKAQKWQLLLALERKTLAELYTLTSTLSVNPPWTPVAVLSGYLYGILLALLPWKLNMQILLSGTRSYLPLFERVKAQAEPPFEEISSYLLAHEQALKAFIEHELIGNSHRAALIITQILDRKIELQISS